MEIYVIVGFVAIILLFGIATPNSIKKRRISNKKAYKYTAKTKLMSATEANFFMKLSKTVQERYYVFPQVHLSALLDHKIKGQSWKPAFSHINSKSVDYVLCDKANLRPIYAIELDDKSHERSDRQERDMEVERIFNEAKLPLVRFQNKDVSENEIIQALTEAKELISS